MARWVSDDKFTPCDDTSTCSPIPPSIALEQDISHKPHYGFAFWAIFAGLVLTALISALDGSVISTALPTIIHDLEAGNNYVWIINVYFLTGYLLIRVLEMGSPLTNQIHQGDVPTTVWPARRSLGQEMVDDILRRDIYSRKRHLRRGF
jgi:hypothetical protein